MNLIMESNFGINILIGTGTCIISKFGSIYLLSPGEGKNIIASIKGNLYSVCCKKPKETRWLGGSFWNPWNAMNEHNFCDILRPVLEQPFLFALRDSPQSTAILKYIVETPNCANWKNENTLLIAPIGNGEGQFYREFLTAVETAGQVFHSIMKIDPGCTGRDKNYIYYATINAIEKELWKNTKHQQSHD